MKTIKTEDGERYFAFSKRGAELEVIMDKELAEKMTDEIAQLAMDNCPVGSIIKKEIGFAEPIGTRKYDKQPIGSDIDG
jgi:[NiFe] hydrogenase diaphorase moiety small subunit